MNRRLLGKSAELLDAGIAHAVATIATAMGSVPGKAGASMIVLADGRNVFPDDVERVLNTLPGVKESAAVGQPYHISYGGKCDFEYADDAAKAEALAGLWSLLGIPGEAVLVEVASQTTHEAALVTKPMLEERGLERGPDGLFRSRDGQAAGY